MAEKWDDVVGGRGKLGVRELGRSLPRLPTTSSFTEVHGAFRAVAHNVLGELVVQLSLAAGGPVRIDDARSPGPRPARDALFIARTAAYFQQATGWSRSELPATPAWPWGGITFTSWRIGCSRWSTLQWALRQSARSCCPHSTAGQAREAGA